MLYLTYFYPYAGAITYSNQSNEGLMCKLTRQVLPKPLWSMMLLPIA